MLGNIDEIRISKIARWKDPFKRSWKQRIYHLWIRCKYQFWKWYWWLFPPKRKPAPFYGWKEFGFQMLDMNAIGIGLIDPRSIQAPEPWMVEVTKEEIDNAMLVPGEYKEIDGKFYVRRGMLDGFVDERCS